jgi:hypothetical protein
MAFSDTFQRKKSVSHARAGYRKLLDAVAATNHNQQVDVHKIIGD